MNERTFDCRGKDIYNEPLSDEVIRGFKELYKHDDNKKYNKEFLVELLQTSLTYEWDNIYQWRRTKTSALDVDGLSTKIYWEYARTEIEKEMIKLNTWYQEENLWSVDWEGDLLWEKVEKKKEEVTTLMKNLIVDSIRYNLVSNRTRCFFLKKNIIVTTYKDLRTIGLAPTPCLLYENMVADLCSRSLRALMKNQYGKPYQFGGAKFNSTIDAIYSMYSIKRHDTDIDIFVDISSAYESVRLDILMADLINEKDLDNQSKSALVSVVYWYYVTDMDMDGNVVQRTQSLGMGNVLTPVLFCYYVHKAMMRLDKNLYKEMSAFIDDLLIRTTFEKMETLIENLKVILENYNLKLNLKKTEVMATPIVISFKMKKIKELGINTKKKIRYLGAFMMMVGSKVTFDQKKIGLYLIENRVSLTGISLTIKLVYLTASVTGKWRYGLYTLIVETNRDKVFNKIRRKIAKFTGYHMVDYEDVIAFGLSPITIMTRMIVNTSVNEEQNWETLIKRVMDKIEEIIINSPRLSTTLCFGKNAIINIIETIIGGRINMRARPSSEEAHKVIKTIVNTIHRMILGTREWITRTRFYKFDIFYTLFNEYTEKDLPDNKKLDIQNLRIGAIEMITNVLGYYKNLDPRKEEWTCDLLIFVKINRIYNEEPIPKELVIDVLIDLEDMTKLIKQKWKKSEIKDGRNTKERRASKFVKKNLLKIDLLYHKVIKEPGFGLGPEELNQVRSLDVKSMIYKWK